MKSLVTVSLMAFGSVMAGEVIVNNSSGKTDTVSDGSSINSGIELGANIQLRQGSGRIISERRSLAQFSKIDCQGISRVEIDCDEKDGAAIEVKADNNLISVISAKIEGGTLRIKPDVPVSATSGIGVVIHGAKELSSLNITGSGSVKLERLNSQSFMIDLRGNWFAILQGSSSELNVSFNGVGKVDAAELKTGKATVRARGNGELTLQSAALSLDLIGPVTIHCKGKPVILSQSMVGGGKLDVGQ